MLPMLRSTSRGSAAGGPLEGDMNRPPAACSAPLFVKYSLLARNVVPVRGWSKEPRIGEPVEICGDQLGMAEQALGKRLR